MSDPRGSAESLAPGWARPVPLWLHAVIGLPVLAALAFIAWWAL